MRPSATVQLDWRHSQIVADVLATVGGQIGAVKVYGSRATGKARPSSDLDLVIFPPVKASVIGELAQAFEESDLPIFVDVIAWEHISNPVLRAEIEKHAIPFS
jgi:uncharacterized protein